MCLGQTADFRVGQEFTLGAVRADWRLRKRRPRFSSVRARSGSLPQTIRCVAPNSALVSSTGASDDMSVSGRSLDHDKMGQGRQRHHATSSAVNR